MALIMRYIVVKVGAATVISYNMVVGVAKGIRNLSGWEDPDDPATHKRKLEKWLEENKDKPRIECPPE